MSRFPALKEKEVIKTLGRLGFFLHHQRGSHAQFKHPDGRRTTVPVHGGKDIGKKTVHAILQDIHISSEEFLKVLRG